MKYNIKVGEKWLIGESVTETIKGTVWIGEWWKHINDEPPKEDNDG